MKNYFVIAFLSFLLGFMMSYILKINHFSNEENGSKSMYVDTVIRLIPSEPLILEKVKAKIVYTRDTVIQTQPFVASVDTILKQDTVFARYEFPENLFSMNLRRADDTLKTVMIKTEFMKDNCNNWWKSPAIAVAGVIAGYLLRKYSEK